MGQRSELTGGSISIFGISGLEYSRSFLRSHCNGDLAPASWRTSGGTSRTFSGLSRCTLGCKDVGIDCIEVGRD